MSIGTVVVLLGLLSVPLTSLGELVVERRAARAAAVEADLAEWQAYREAFLAARPQRVAPGARRGPLFYAARCDPAA